VGVSVTKKKNGKNFTRVRCGGAGGQNAQRLMGGGLRGGTNKGTTADGQKLKTKRVNQSPKKWSSGNGVKAKQKEDRASKKSKR